MTRECRSVDGEWGGICPRCGRQLPEKVSGPPSSKRLRVSPWTTTGRHWPEARKAAYLRGPKSPPVR